MQVNVFIEEGDKLGLRIRGGSEYGLGIYIAGVDPNSAAQKAGLKVTRKLLYYSDNENRRWHASHF